MKPLTAALVLMAGLTLFMASCSVQPLPASPWGELDGWQLAKEI
jgi:hypothetical protein